MELRVERSLSNLTVAIQQEFQTPKVTKLPRSEANLQLQSRWDSMPFLIVK